MRRAAFFLCREIERLRNLPEAICPNWATIGTIRTLPSPDIYVSGVSLR